MLDDLVIVDRSNLGKYLRALVDIEVVRELWLLNVCSVAPIDAVAGGGRMDAVASLSQQRCPVLCEVDSDDVFSCGSARLHSLRNQRLVILRARGALSEQGSNMGAGNIQLRLRSSAGVDDHGDEDHSVGSEITHEWVEPMGTRV